MGIILGVLSIILGVLCLILGVMGIILGVPKMTFCGFCKVQPSSKFKNGEQLS